ncbi:autotransporter-associated beta strand repeat-containing protein, partial [Ferrovum sp. PN-J185]
MIKPPLQFKLLVTIASLFSLGAHAAPAVTALPGGGVVSAGNAVISQSVGANSASMTINQSSQRAVIDWNSYNVGQNATVTYNQPNSQSSTLNRISDPNVSQIFGQIKSNGEVVLVNPQGVYFSPSASVNVGALVATTNNISDSDYMKGKATYSENGTTGSVVNEGNITAGLGRYVALLAPAVRNNGIIIAQMGTVVLAAGNTITLNFNSGNHLASITATPSHINALVENHNAVIAPGGLIILSARAANELVGEVINQGGKVSVSNLALNQVGGRIVIDGDNVNLNNQSQTLAQGNSNGGQVSITGNNIALNAGSTVNTSSTNQGNGGSVYVMSQTHTTVNGSIKSQGGVNGGNGGVVETSSHGSLTIGSQANINVSAQNAQGTNGNWVLDPYNLTIDSTAASVISQALNTGSVTLSVNSAGCSSVGTCSTGAGDLIINSGVVIQKTSGSQSTLNLVADGAVINNGTITGTLLDVNIQAAQVLLNAGSQINANQVSVTSSQSFVSYGSINGMGNNPLINILAGTFDLFGVITANNTQGSAGSITITTTSGNLNLESASQLTANGSLNGGSITLGTNNIGTISSQGYIQTNGGNGLGGTIKLGNSPSINLSNSNLNADGQTGGLISLSSNTGDITLQNSIIQTNGQAGPGGTILISGANSTSLTNNTIINAQGLTQGGTIKIGNDAINKLIPFSAITTLDSTTTLNAQQTDPTNITNGGYIETSGHTLNLLASINAGRGGMWLLDPTDITIDATTAASIETALNNNTDVTIQTTSSGYTCTNATCSNTTSSGSGNITVSASITSTGSGNLTLSAYNNITISAAINIGGALTLTAYGGTTSYNGNVTLAGDTSLTTNNNNIIFNSNVDGTTANSQALTISNGTGTVTFTGSIGAIVPLSSISINYTNATAISTGNVNLGGSVTTSGNQSFGGNLVLTATNINLTSTNNGNVLIIGNVSANLIEPTNNDLIAFLGSGVFEYSTNAGQSYTTLTLTSTPQSIGNIGSFSYSGNSYIFTPNGNTTNYYNTLLVAGGGGGGANYGNEGGGGGGGGGVGVGTLNLVGGVSYSITVGAGGLGSSSPNSQGANGNNTSIVGGIVSEIAVGGGGGGTGSSYGTYSTGLGGGSGGGGNGYSSAHYGGTGYNSAYVYMPSNISIPCTLVCSTVNTATSTPNIAVTPLQGTQLTYYGNAGGSAQNETGGGGGGGALSVGQASPQYNGGNGGSGIPSTLLGTSTVYGGGGGGGHWMCTFNAVTCAGGLGGGGGAGSGGGQSAGNVNGNSATANSGGGGGGGIGGQATSGGNGGSGIAAFGFGTVTGTLSGSSLTINSGSGKTTIGGISTNLIAINITSSNSANQISGSISGPTNLSFTGAVAGSPGTLILTGTNTYTGITTINSGTLQIGISGGITGTVGTGEIVDNGNLLFVTNGSSVVNNLITGSGSITKQSSSYLTLNNSSNQYSGGTTVNAGTLIVGNNNALGTGTLTLSNGTTLQAGATTIGLSNPIALTGAATINAPSSDTLTVSGGITGAYGLTINGTSTYTGTVVINNSNNTSTTTAVQYGTLQIGDGINAGSLGSGAVTNNSSLVFDLPSSGLVVSNNIGGSGTLTLSAGNLTLNGANTYSGGTTVDGGILTITNNSGLGATTGTVQVNSGAILDLQNVAVGANPMTLSGGTVRDTTSSYAGNITLTSNSTLSATNAGDVLTLSGVISGTNYGVTVSGLGTVALTNANTYTGTTSISSGTLQLGSGGSIASASALVMSGTANLDLYGNNQTFASLTGGASDEIYNSKASTTSTLSVAGGTTTFAGVIKDNIGSGGVVGLTVQGGQLTLSGGNTFTGSLTVSNGTVNLDGSSASAMNGTKNITIENNGVLAISGGGYNQLNGTGLTVTISSGGALENTQIGTGGIGQTLSEPGGSSTINLQGNATISAVGAGDTYGSWTFHGSNTINLSGTNNSITGGAIANDGTLTVNVTGPQSISSVIENSSGNPGSLKVTGTGTLTLSGANTYSGGTTVSGGTLVVGNNSALGTGTLTLANATALQAGASTIALSNPIVLSGAATINAPSSDTLTLSGVITGANGLTINGSSTYTGTVVLSGINTYSGGTTVNGGVLTVNSVASINSGISGVVLNGGELLFNINSNSGTFTLLNTVGNPVTFYNNLFRSNINPQYTFTAGSSGDVTQLTLQLNNTAAYINPASQMAPYVSVTLTSGGSTVGTFNYSSFNSTTNTVTLTGNANIVAGGSYTLILGGQNVANTGFNQTSTNSTTTSQFTGNPYGGYPIVSLVGVAQNLVMSGVISGIGAVVKQGSGDLTLSGDNTYSGGTTVSGGTLVVGNNSALGNASVSVASGSSLNVNGYTIGNIISVAGTGVNNSSVVYNGNTSSSGSVGGLVLTGDSTVSAVNGLSVAGSITGAYNLIINSGSSTVNLNGTVGSTAAPLTSLTINGSNTAYIQNNITTSQNVNFNENVGLLGGDVSGGTITPIVITSQNGNISLVGTLTSGASSKTQERSITVTANNGSVTFNGQVGSPLSTLYSNYSNVVAISPYQLVVSAATININADITTLNAQTYNGSVVIGDNGTNGIIRTIISVDPQVYFNGTVNDTTAGAHVLDVAATTNSSVVIPMIAFMGNVGNNAALQSLTVGTGWQDTQATADIGQILSGKSNYNGQVIIAGNVTTQGSQSYTTGQIQLGNNGTGQNQQLTITGNGNITMNTKTSGIAPLGTGSTLTVNIKGAGTLNADAQSNLATSGIKYTDNTAANSSIANHFSGGNIASQTNIPTPSTIPGMGNTGSTTGNVTVGNTQSVDGGGDSGNTQVASNDTGSGSSSSSDQSGSDSSTAPGSSDKAKKSDKKDKEEQQANNQNGGGNNNAGGNKGDNGNGGQQQANNQNGGGNNNAGGNKGDNGNGGQQQANNQNGGGNNNAGGNKGD